MQRYDAEHDEARYKFDLDRDEAQRRFIAALWGVELKDTLKPLPTNGRKQTLTQQDIMRNYGK